MNSISIKLFSLGLCVEMSNPEPMMSTIKRNDSGEQSTSDVKPDIMLVEESGIPGSDKASSNDTGKALISDEERKLVWKLDKRIMPILCLMYLFACALLEA